MKRLVAPIVFAGVALAAGAASADTYWRNNGLLLEVSADARDGRDVVQVDPTSADSLEIVALNDSVMLRDLTLHLSDGRTISQRVGMVAPGQPVLVDLPESCHGGAITSVELDYGNRGRAGRVDRFDRSERSDARLQIIPRGMHRDRPQVSYAPTYATPTYATPTYATPTYATPSYVNNYPAYRAPVYQVQARQQPRRARATWRIQGSFRF